MAVRIVLQDIEIFRTILQDQLKRRITFEDGPLLFTPKPITTKNPL